MGILHNFEFIIFFQISNAKSTNFITVLFIFHLIFVFCFTCTVFLPFQSYESFSYLEKFFKNQNFILLVLFLLFFTLLIYPSPSLLFSFSLFFILWAHIIVFLNFFDLSVSFSFFFLHFLVIMLFQLSKSYSSLHK